MKIDPEFRDLLPALTDKEHGALEKMILAEGCRDAFVVWGDTLIDGHNRYAICQKHGLGYPPPVNMEFNSKDEVKAWIIATQLSRRNLSVEQIVYYRGLRYNAEKTARGSNNQYVQAKSENGQNVRFQNKDTVTSNKLADEYGEAVESRKNAVEMRR